MEGEKRSRGLWKSRNEGPIEKVLQMVIEDRYVIIPKIAHLLSNFFVPKYRSPGIDTVLNKS